MESKIQINYIKCLELLNKMKTCYNTIRKLKHAYV